MIVAFMIVALQLGFRNGMSIARALIGFAVVLTKEALT